MSKDVDVGDVANPHRGVSEIPFVEGIIDTPIGDWETSPTSPTSPLVADGLDGVEEDVDLGFEPHRPPEDWKPLLPKFQSILDKMEELGDNNE